MKKMSPDEPHINMTTAHEHLTNESGHHKATSTRFPQHSANERWKLSVCKTPLMKPKPPWGQWIRAEVTWSSWSVNVLMETLNLIYDLKREKSPQCSWWSWHEDVCQRESHHLVSALQAKISALCQKQINDGLKTIWADPPEHWLNARVWSSFTWGGRGGRGGQEPVKHQPPSRNMERDTERFWLAWVMITIMRYKYSWAYRVSRRDGDSWCWLLNW